MVIVTNDNDNDDDDADADDAYNDDDDTKYNDIPLIKISFSSRRALSHSLRLSRIRNRRLRKVTVSICHPHQLSSRLSAIILLVIVLYVTYLCPPFRGN